MDIQEIYTYDNLFDSAIKCSKNVKWKRQVAHYLLNICDETLKIYNEVQNGTYKERQHKVFKIYEPKEREVLSICFRDRVYQRLLNDLVIYPRMTSNFVNANCACQKGKGTDFARNLLLKFMRSYYQSHKSNEGYIIHIDIKHYYPSMSHEIAENLFKEKLDQETFALVHEILKVYEGETGYNPGSQLVQILGISMLNNIDHFIKEKLHVKYYVRYMDDLMLIVEDNPQYYIDEVEKQLETLKLYLNKAKTKYCKLSKGDVFLGFKYYITKTGKVLMIIDNKNVKRRKRKMNKSYQLQSIQEFKDSYQTWRSYADRTSNKAFLEKIDGFYKTLLSEKEKHMNAKARINLSKLGFEGMEIDALDKIIDMAKEINEVSEGDEYSKKINSLIREKYSLSQELAIIRQKDTKVEEFNEYNVFVEECKQKANEANK